MIKFLARMFARPEPPAAPEKQKEGEETGRQVKGGVVTGSAGELPKVAERTIQTWREMRKHPALALSRAIATGPIRAAEYATEVEPELAETQPKVAEEREDFVDSVIEPLWRDLMRNIIFGFDYGFQAFEKVYAAKDGRQVLAKLKMLLADITYVVLEQASGDFRGATNGKKMFGSTAGGKFLPAEKVFWYTHNREGDYWYGESVMDRALKDYNWYNDTAAKAKQYYTGIAGAIPLLEYPEGESKDQGGQTKNNYLLAIDILQSLKSAAGVAFPGIEAAYIDAIAKQGMDPTKLSAWRLNMFEARASHGPEFEAGLTARNRGMVQSWLLPVRAVLEGEHGTNAEAETQTETAMVSLNAIMQDIFDAINKWVVNPLLVLNYGQEAADSVKLITEVQDPKKAELLREIVKGIFGAPVNADLFEDTFDIATVFELLDLPIVENYDVAIADKKARDEANAKQQAATAAAMAAAAANPPPPSQLALTPAKIKEVHGHAKIPDGEIGWYFHNFATHDDMVGYQHCVGAPSNPSKLEHFGAKHGISKEYARGHGAGNTPQWFHFTKSIKSGWWDLASFERVEVKDVPKGFK